MKLVCESACAFDCSSSPSSSFVFFVHIFMCTGVFGTWFHALWNILVVPHLTFGIASARVPIIAPFVREFRFRFEKNTFFGVTANNNQQQLCYMKQAPPGTKYPLHSILLHLLSTAKTSNSHTTRSNIMTCYHDVNQLNPRIKVLEFSTMQWQNN